MPFGVASGVGREMGVLDRVLIVEGKEAVLGGEYGASHCNQWGLCCVVVRKCGVATHSSQITLERTCLIFLEGPL